MCGEVVDFLGRVSGETIIDATLGDGGHAEALLEARQDIVLLGIDRDARAIERSRERLARFGERFVAVEGEFAGIGEIFSNLSLRPPCGILFDLGVSSRQIDDPDCGFSFGGEARLDMRMGNAGRSAADFLNGADREAISQVLRDFGEVQSAWRIAGAIVERRTAGPLETAADLVAAVAKVENNYSNADLARVFQAIRIFVNDELEQLRYGIRAALELLIPDGVIVVISYHSLEDRIVKQFFAEEERGCICPPELPVCRCGHKPSLKRLVKKPLRPTEEEIGVNPRARSAKLRAAMKL